jgi:hypothetical protein
LGRVELELELTDRVLALRSLRDAGLDWPTEPASVAEAASCAGASWVYRQESNGDITLALEPPLPESDTPFAPPLSFRIRAPAD